MSQKEPNLQWRFFFLFKNPIFMDRSQTDKLLKMIDALLDVQVTVPRAVRRGDSAVLYCYYDMGDEKLYSVKWYKGRREFYRYTPKETPPMKVFSVPGVQVKRVSSNESQVMLNSLNNLSSGRYSCEVSAEAPSFHTMIVTGDLEVCEVPKHVPLIHGIRQRYRLGDILRGNCSSAHSRPAANLTWFINEQPVNPSHIKNHKPFRDRNSDLETSTIGVHFVVSNHHFQHGKLKIRCTARIHDIYLQSTEKTIYEERPHVISAASSSSNGNGNNQLHNIPYDQFQLDNEVDRKDYMTHLQGDMSSSASGSLPSVTRSVPSIRSSRFLAVLLAEATGLLIVFHHLLKFGTISIT
ncbi:AAEL005649-PA [Aedes aegypti]|uniref:AAEL005649-PA n=1 Tax=Aedes aegypti TaxID=7159 RepID=Q179G5_AEDAE|nr:AAEL005649-PA [Aedes aegypti]